jgi:tetratricopeptide (TPR) repeat protein
MQPQDAPSQPSVPYSSNFYEQGRAAFSARQWAQAAILLDRAEAEHPGKTDALVFRAEALLSLNRLHEADAALTAYTSAHPHSADALYLMGLVLQREKQPQRSLETLTTAASLRKPEANDLKIVAFDYVELKDYTDATHWFEVAVAMDPRNPELLYGLGRCYYAQSRFADAERAFNHVLEMDPRNIKAAENLGLALMYENRPEQAEKSFQRAIDLSRETRGRDEWPYLDYGSFLIDQNRSTDAIQVLKQGVALAPESSECHEKLGRALVQSGNAAAGIIEFEHAVSLKPSDAHLHYELGLAYRKAGMAEKAKTEFATSSALYGTKSEQERP